MSTDMTPATARRLLADLIDRYGGKAVHDAFAGRLTQSSRPVLESLDPPRVPDQLNQVVEAIGREEFDRKTMRGGEEPSRGVEETPEGTAQMQEAGLSTDEITREVEVAGDPGARRYEFDDGVGDPNTTYIPPEAYMAAVDEIRQTLGDANQFEAYESAGTVRFERQRDGVEFVGYDVERPDRDYSYTPTSDSPGDTPDDAITTDFGSLEPQRIEDSPPADRTTQGTLGERPDAGEARPFPTEPDERTRRAMERSTEQKGLGDSPSRDDSARATRSAERRQRRQEEQASESQPDDQLSLADLGKIGDDAPRITDFERDQEDDQEGN